MAGADRATDDTRVPLDALHLILHVPPPRAGSQRRRWHDAAQHLRPLDCGTGRTFLVPGRPGAAAVRARRRSRRLVAPPVSARTTRSPSGSTPCWPSSTWSSTKAMSQASAPNSREPAVRRGLSAPPPAGRASARRARAEGGWPDAAPRRSPRTHTDDEGAIVPARRSGPLARGSREDHRGLDARRAGPASPPAGRIRSGGDRSPPRPGPVRARHRRPQSPRCSACSWGSTIAVVELNARWRFRSPNGSSRPRPTGCYRSAGDHLLPAAHADLLRRLGLGPAAAEPASIGARHQHG